MYEKLCMDESKRMRQFVLSADIDLMVEETCLFTLEEIQIDLLQKVKNDMRRDDVQKRFPPSMNLSEFKNRLEDSLDKKRNHAAFLASRYDQAGRVNVGMFYDEMELLRRGISPLTTWATPFCEDIVKAIQVAGGSLDTYFKRHSENFLELSPFKNAMDMLHISKNYSTHYLDRFFNNLDTEKKGRISQKTLENCIRGLTNGQSPVDLVFRNAVNDRDSRDWFLRMRNESTVSLSVFEEELKNSSLSKQDYDLLVFMYRIKESNSEDRINLSAFLDDLSAQRTTIAQKQSSQARPGSARSKTPTREEEKRPPGAKNVDISSAMRDIQGDLPNLAQPISFYFTEEQKQYRDGVMPENKFRRKIETIGLRVSTHKMHDLVDFYRSGKDHVDFRAFITEVERLKPQTPAGRPPRSGAQVQLLGEERRLMDNINDWF